jgi:hypothetical protein
MLGKQGTIQPVADMDELQATQPYEGRGGVMLTTLKGTPGYMSYQDIEDHLEDETGTVHYDEEAAVQYYTYAPLAPCSVLVFLLSGVPSELS